MPVVYFRTKRNAMDKLDAVSRTWVEEIVRSLDEDDDFEYLTNTLGKDAGLVLDLFLRCPWEGVEDPSQEMVPVKILFRELNEEEKEQRRRDAEALKKKLKELLDRERKNLSTDE
jgi:hypothetical protein